MSPPPRGVHQAHSVSDRIQILKTIGLFEELTSICRRHFVTLANALRLNKSPSHARARREMCILLRERRMSYPEIGGLLGMCHSSVMWHVNKGKEKNGSRSNNSSK